MAVRFDLPIDDAGMQEARVRVKIDGQPSAAAFPLKGRRGVFALATERLKPGEYTVRLLVEDTGKKEPLYETSFSLVVHGGWPCGD